MGLGMKWDVGGKEEERKWSEVGGRHLFKAEAG
jgi:hypothetical protein